MPGPLIISLSGTKLLEKEKKLLASKMVGGLVLFRENYDESAENPKEDLKHLIKEIRKYNPDIVIMVDHEGGKVWRFNKGFTKLLSAKEYGDLFEKDKKSASEKIFKDAYTMASELLDCGIDISLTPVVDLDGPSNVIGKLLRAYHKNPEIIIEIAEQFIKGMNKAGMPATLKHFPGHGTCKLDSHIEAPTDDRSLNDLQIDMKPFKDLIGKNIVGAVMSNFVIYPAVDSKNVAAFSPAWLNEWLRKNYKFNGIIMSDCLHMKGADVGENIKRLQSASAAGNDFLMYTHQHGEKLDQLVAILDRIPDTKEANERRNIFAKSIQRRILPEPLLSGSLKSNNLTASNTISSNSIDNAISNSNANQKLDQNKTYSIL